MKNYWMGELIDDMPREKLVEIIDHLGSEVAELRSPARIRAYALGSVEMMRRGEGTKTRKPLRD
jgi:hypothetical protein